VDIPHASPNLYNEDLAPVVERKWGASSIFNVLTSDVPSHRSYCLAASLFLLCGGFLDFIIAPGTGVEFSSILPDFSNVLPPWWAFCDLAIVAAFYVVVAAMVPKPVPQSA
jgi:hypothetical protein